MKQSITRRMFKKTRLYPSMPYVSEKWLVACTMTDDGKQQPKQNMTWQEIQRLSHQSWGLWEDELVKDDEERWAVMTAILNQARLEVRASEDGSILACYSASDSPRP
jgi:hypothetical protein